MNHSVNLHIPNFYRSIKDKNNKALVDDGSGKLVLANTKFKITKFSATEMALMKSNTTKELERDIEMIVD